MRNSIISIHCFWTSVIRTLVLAPYVCRKHGSRRMTTLLYIIFPIIILSTRVKKCSGHGGLIIYIHDRYHFEVRNVCPESRIWEGLFIDIYGTDRKKAITLGNVYRQPKDNNSDSVISTFIDELSPIIQTLSSENSETILVGDFNIDLLKVNENIGNI